MFSKRYKGKKVLNRHTYIGACNVVIRVRNIGKKSGVKFQQLIDSGELDKTCRLKWQFQQIENKGVENENNIR